MKKKHTKENGYFKDECHYSRTGWAWWKYPKPGDVCIVPSCTCIPCKPPKLTAMVAQLADNVQKLLLS